MKEIYQASEASMQAATRRGRGSKYPWEKLEVGQCFTVDYGEMKKATLVPFAFRMSKKLGKVFKVKDHPQYQKFEVVRHPDKGSAVVLVEQVPIRPAIAQPETPSLKWGEHLTEAKPISEENERRWGKGE